MQREGGRAAVGWEVTKIGEKINRATAATFDDSVEDGGVLYPIPRQDTPPQRYAVLSKVWVTRMDIAGKFSHHALDECLRTGGLFSELLSTEEEQPTGV